MADILVQGLADLHKALQELPVKIERNVLRGALRAGAMVIRDEARRIVPVRSGALRDSIRVSMSTRRGQVRASVKTGSKAAYYAHMVEFGTARHWIKPKNRKSLFFAGLAKEVVDHPGARRRPFMRPALDAKAAEGVEAVAQYIRQRLPKEFAKLMP